MRANKRPVFESHDLYWPIRMLELQREMEEQEEKDKDFSLLQRLAEEEVRQLQCFLLWSLFFSLF